MTLSDHPGNENAGGPRFVETKASHLQGYGDAAPPRRL